MRALAAVAVVGTTALTSPARADDGYPPQGHPYPPPPYGPPPGYQPPGDPAPAARRPSGGGFQAVPYLGLHSFSGEGTSGADPGLRLGAILGGRVFETLSANGEITIDVMNYDARSESGAMVQMTFSPLYHMGSPAAEIVIGPKLGAWAMSRHASDSGLSAAVEEQGWTVGVNAGVFFPVGQGTSSLGMLFSLASLQVTHCNSATGEMCPNIADGDLSVSSLTFAALL